MGNKKKQDLMKSIDLVWSSLFEFLIQYEITWLCRYKMAEAEICIDVTVMRKTNLLSTDFFWKFGEFFIRINEMTRRLWINAYFDPDDGALFLILFF